MSNPTDPTAGDDLLGGARPDIEEAIDADPTPTREAEHAATVDDIRRAAAAREAAAAGVYVDDAELARQQITALLDALMPPDELTVEDLTGQPHSLRVRLPAVVERRVLKAIERFTKAVSGALDIRGIRGAGDAQRVVAQLLDALDDEALGVLGEAFATAHPRAARVAAEAVAADEELMELLDLTAGITPRPEHCFDAADLIEALVPFVGRYAAKLRPIVLRTLGA